MRIWSAGALCALAVGAAAQTSIPPNVAQSVLMVLATALPRESASYALASSSAFAAQMASSLAAGNTPAWYQALPADVKTLLPAIYPAAVATPTPTPSASSSHHVTASISARPTGVNSTSITSVQAPTLSAATGPSSARSSAPAAATGAASLPSAAMGAGIGAALGFIGMLAL